MTGVYSFKVSYSGKFCGFGCLLYFLFFSVVCFFFFQAEDGIRDGHVTGVQTCALPISEVAVGMPSVIDAALLVHHVGLGRARELLLTGDRLDARRALEWGLVTVLVADAGDLLEAAAMLVGRIAVNDPAAIAQQKELIEEWLNLPLEEAIARSTAALGRAFATGVPQRLCAARRKRSST